MRLALGYAGLFIASSLLLVGLLWWRTAAYLDREIDAVIVADTQAIGERLRDFGLEDAAQTVQDRVRSDIDRNAIFLDDRSGVETARGQFEILAAGGCAGLPAGIRPICSMTAICVRRGCSISVCPGITTCWSAATWATAPLSVQ